MALLRSDGKRPDEATLIPWTRGKPLAIDITVADTYANSYVEDTATIEAAAADRAASSKTAKYTELSKTYHFTSIAIETFGSWKDLAIEFIAELGKMITAVTQEPRETQYLANFREYLSHGREEMRLRFRTISKPSINFYYEQAIPLTPYLI